MNNIKNEFPNPPDSFHNALKETLSNLPERGNVRKRFKIKTAILIAACICVAATIAIAGSREYRVFQIPKAEFEVSDTVSEEYYKIRDRQEGMKLYVSDKENFYMQIPEKAFVSEGVHIDEDTNADTCTIRFNHYLLSVLYNYMPSDTQYSTLEEVINAIAEDGITMHGEVKDFETFELNDDIKGYRFYQYLSEKSWTEYIHYYTSSGTVGISVQAHNPDSYDKAVLEKVLSSILIK
ncbi:MAG: hypothetical protein J1F01_02620 [Oscillospiraceae bacterium]|nr:hypothetical protein [Oscillospiraceae bacterium]